jgi:RNA polymerase sigma-70 factor (ECF subfamily)
MHVLGESSRGEVDQVEREATWAQWMRQALAGNERHYRLLLEALASRLRVSVRYRFTRVGCGDLDVEDVVQETLLAIHLKRHTWRIEEPIGPWVAAISRNKLVDVLRRRGRRAELPLDDVAEPEAETPETGADEDVARLLEGLNERQRDIVRLVSIEGHSAREAAVRLGMTEGALRVALHRTLRTLATQLRNENR